MKFYLFFFLFAQILFAQKISSFISGWVLDAKTLEPLPGVNVYLAETSIGASTDAKGFYRIINIPPGSYTLICSMVGYNYKTEALNIFDEKSQLQLNFQLKGKTYRLDSISVKTERDSEWERNKQIFLKEFLVKLIELKNAK